jgi:hypothetical protein
VRMIDPLRGDCDFVSSTLNGVKCLSCEND